MGETAQTKVNPKIVAPAYLINQLMTTTNFACLPNTIATSLTFQVEHQTWTASTTVAAVFVTLIAFVVRPIITAFAFLFTFWWVPAVTIISIGVALVGLMLNHHFVKIRSQLRLWYLFRCTRSQFESADRLYMTHWLEVWGRAESTMNSNRWSASFWNNWCRGNLKVICRSPNAWRLRQIDPSGFSDQKVISLSQTGLICPGSHLQFAFGWRLKSTLYSPLKFFRVIWDYHYSWSWSWHPLAVERLVGRDVRRILWWFKWISVWRDLDRPDRVD